MRYLTKVCVGAISGAALLVLCVPESSLDTTLGPALVAACAWAAGPLSTTQGRARAATGCGGVLSQLRTVAAVMAGSHTREGAAWAARASAAAIASEQLGLSGRNAPGTAVATPQSPLVGDAARGAGAAASGPHGGISSGGASRLQAAGAELV